MNEIRKTNRGPILLTAALCLAAGAAAGWFIQQRQPKPTAQTIPSPTPAPLQINTPPPPEKILVSLPVEAMKRMDLQLAPVTAEAGQGGLRVPGTVEANGYREVPVAPVAGGIIREVSAELGQSVKRGQKMARIFSQELADAQTALIAMDVDLEVAHKKLLRTQELLKLGAASQQELEEVEGEHESHMAHIEQARQKLILLGLTPAQADRVRTGTQVSSETDVPAPIDGVVLTRNVNLGQVVAMGQELFKVTDLSSVWIEGNLLEDDFAKVHTGAKATITTPAYPNRAYKGTVDYIDPRVDPQTRTAKVRVIVENADRALRLGMYADIQFTTAAASAVAVIPTAALQQIGTKSVVYVPVEGAETQFEQRTVTTGEATPRGLQILSGISTKDRVVTNGSFLLRAEALRQHPQQ